MHVFSCLCVQTTACGGHRTTYGCQLSPSTMWVPNSGCETWWPALSPAEPSHRSPWFCLTRLQSYPDIFTGTQKKWGEGLPLDTLWAYNFKSSRSRYTAFADNLSMTLLRAHTYAHAHTPMGMSLTAPLNVAINHSVSTFLKIFSFLFLLLLVFWDKQLRVICCTVGLLTPCDIAAPQGFFWVPFQANGAFVI